MFKTKKIIFWCSLIALIIFINVYYKKVITMENVINYIEEPKNSSVKNEIDKKRNNIKVDEYPSITLFDGKIILNKTSFNEFINSSNIDYIFSEENDLKLKSGESYIFKIQQGLMELNLLVENKSENIKLASECPIMEIKIYDEEKTFDFKINYNNIRMDSSLNDVIDIMGEYNHSSNLFISTDYNDTYIGKSYFWNWKEIYNEIWYDVCFEVHYNTYNIMNYLCLSISEFV